MADFMQLQLQKRDYLTESLGSDGGLGSLMQDVVTQAGTFYAIVPKGTSAARAEQFERGGLTTAREAEHELIACLQDCVGVFIVQDFWAPNTRYDYLREPAEVFSQNGKVYLWTELSQTNIQAIQSCWRLPTSWDYAGFLVEDHSAAERLRQGNARVEDFADHVSELYVPAYDQESFVMWVR